MKRKIAVLVLAVVAAAGVVAGISSYNGVVHDDGSRVIHDDGMR